MPTFTRQSPILNSKSETPSPKSIKVRDFIQANKPMFRAGNTFPESHILNLFNISLPTTSTIQATRRSHRNFFAKQRSAQSYINKILAMRGLVLSQVDEDYTVNDIARGTKAKASIKSNYTTTDTEPSASPTIDYTRGHYRQSVLAEERGILLAQGINSHNSRWSTITNRQLGMIRFY